jgi:hypothetical protein
MNCKVSHIVVSSSRPKVSLSRICCRGQGHQHAFSVYNLQKIQSCRNRYYAVCAKMRDAASTDDSSRSLEIRSRDGGFNGASIHNSFNRLEADITEVTYSQTSLANPRFQVGLHTKFSCNTQCDCGLFLLRYSLTILTRTVCPESQSGTIYVHWKCWFSILESLMIWKCSDQMEACQLS